MTLSYIVLVVVEVVKAHDGQDFVRYTLMLDASHPTQMMTNGQRQRHKTGLQAVPQATAPF